MNSYINYDYMFRLKLAINKSSEKDKSILHEKFVIAFCECAPRMELAACATSWTAYCT